jgi:PAS domain S-box-containing protein
MVLNKDKRIHNNMNVDELFRVMADCAPVLLWVSRTDSSCVFFNKTWLEFTGKSVEDEWGVGWTEGIHFEDFQQCMDTYVQHFNNRTPFEIEYRLRRKDGEYRWLLDKGVPYYDTEGTFLGFIGSCIDITENKKAKELLEKINESLEQRVQQRTADLMRSEAELAKAKSYAEEATNVKSQFVSMVSHDLRSPMTAIKGSLELLLKEENNSSEKNHALINIAYQNTNRLIRLVNDILDIEKIGAGKLRLNLKKQALLPLLQQAIISNEPFAKQYNVDLKLGEVALSACAEVDEDRMLQVLDNLLSNAAKFSAPNSDVYITMTCEQGLLRIAIKDSGNGIPPEFERNIFAQFMQANPANSSSSGLGLHIAKSIVEQHHGSIYFANSPVGCTFYIELPAA